MANIIRGGLERYQEVSKDSHVAAEKYMSEVQRAIEEATMLETPLLEKNLIILSTISSIATMVGLLGTVIGMIRAFRLLPTQVLRMPLSFQSVSLKLLLIPQAV